MLEKPTVTIMSGGADVTLLVVIPLPTALSVMLSPNEQGCHLLLSEVALMTRIGRPLSLTRLHDVVLLHYQQRGKPYDPGMPRSPRSILGYTGGGVREERGRREGLGWRVGAVPELY